ncbi:MAG TPA: hypothetical protein GX723_06815 [Thermoanaerobacterales bacterium]|nr:hypothetical protein [Thermoanaerobacterales bacterium]
MKRTNINAMLKMVRMYLDGKMDRIELSLDFPYELEKRFARVGTGNRRFPIPPKRGLSPPGLCRIMQDELRESQLLRRLAFFSSQADHPAVCFVGKWVWAGWRLIATNKTSQAGGQIVSVK